MNNDAEEFIRFVAEASTPVAMSMQEVEEESWANPEVSQLRECISTGEWGNAPPQYCLSHNMLPQAAQQILQLLCFVPWQ